MVPRSNAFFFLFSRDSFYFFANLFFAESPKAPHNAYETAADTRLKSGAACGSQPARHFLEYFLAQHGNAIFFKIIRP